MTACSNCGWSAPTVIQSDKQDLARVGSVAEAGYLVELLREAGVAAVARPAESFSATHGSWSTAYAIAVSVEDSAAAARVLQAESNADFVEVADRLFDRGSTAADRTGVNPWRMLTVLAIVAATGAAVAIDTFGGGRARRAAGGPAGEDRRVNEPIEHLPQALREAGGVFHAEPQADGARHRLRFLPAAGAWELSIDADRDGRYERHRRFVRPAVAQPAMAR